MLAIRFDVSCLTNLGGPAFSIVDVGLGVLVTNVPSDWQLIQHDGKHYSVYHEYDKKKTLCWPGIHS